MTPRRASLLMFGIAVLFACSGQAQLTVDATGPHKVPDFGTTSGSGGGVGRKLPLQVSLEIEGSPFIGNRGKTLVNFILTNSGKQDLTIPVSPDQTDVEATGSFRELALHVTIGKLHEPWEKNRKPLQSGTNPHIVYIFLYGRQAAPGTLATLAPGEFIRVRAELALPQVSGTDQSNLSFVAHATVNDVDIKTRDGKRLLESHEVGIATSPEYSPQALFKLKD